MIRIATENDAEQLLDIYAYYVKNTVISFEYEVPSVEEFQARIHKTLTKYPYLVSERNGKIIGYAYAGAFKERSAYNWSVETTIYLAHGLQGQGLGKELYLALEKALSLQNILNLNACIGYPTVDDEYLTKNSAQYHEHLGYHLVGEFTKCGYKFGRWYNMIWMEKLIGNHPDKPLPILPFDAIRNTLAEKYNIK